MRVGLRASVNAAEVPDTRCGLSRSFLFSAAHTKCP